MTSFRSFALAYRHLCTGASLQQRPSRDNSLTLSDADAILLAFRLMEPKVQVPANFISSLHLIRVGRGLWNVRAAFPPAACRCRVSLDAHIVLPPRERHALDHSEGQSILVIVKSVHGYDISHHP